MDAISGTVHGRMWMMTRRKLSRAEREKIYYSCDCRCAYCGCEIDYSDMQVDHATPLRIGGADEIENMKPSCRSCNHYKATFDVEGFRKYLSGIQKRLMRDSIPYQIAERFGIVEHKSDNVTFYFERIATEKDEI